MLGIVLKVVLKSSVSFQQNDWSEIEFTGFNGLFTAPMGTMGLGRLDGCKGAQKESQKQNA